MYGFLFLVKKSINGYYQEMEINFIEQASVYLCSNRKHWEGISQESGVSVRWMKHWIVDKTIKEPSAVKIEAVLKHAYSTGWTYKKETQGE